MLAAVALASDRPVRGQGYHDVYDIGARVIEEAESRSSRWTLKSSRRRGESGAGPGVEPEWPMGDPASLMWWLEEGGAERLGRDMNKWLGVIFYASSMIRDASNAAERKAFRDVALAATAAGRRVGGLRDNVYTEKMIYIRMSYIRNSDEDLAWRRSEMDRVLDCFLVSLPMDIASARDKSRNWWEEQPNSVIKSLRQIKTLLKLMRPGGQYLADDRREILEEWLSILPLLP